MRKNLVFAGAMAAMLIAGAARADDQLTLALRISTLAQYVKKNCTSPVPNTPAIVATMDELGYAQGNMLTEARKLQVKYMYEEWEGRGQSTCLIAVELFGPTGIEYPGLFKPR